MRDIIPGRHEMDKKQPGFLLRQIATLSFAGYIPAAPGTFGTLVAAVLVWLLKPGPLPLFLFAVVSILAGTYAAGQAELVLGRDSSHIIIDEFAGYLVSVLFLPLSDGYLLAAFALFRAFDILKPPPIRRMEKLPGGVGVMADDVAAGIAANIVLHLWRIFA